MAECHERKAAIDFEIFQRKVRVVTEEKTVMLGSPEVHNVQNRIKGAERTNAYPAAEYR